MGVVGTADAVVVLAVVLGDVWPSRSGDVAALPLGLMVPSAPTLAGMLSTASSNNLGPLKK